VDGAAGGVGRLANVGGCTEPVDGALGGAVPGAGGNFGAGGRLLFAEDAPGTLGGPEGALGGPLVGAAGGPLGGLPEEGIFGGVLVPSEADIAGATGVDPFGPHHSTS
jgi:hypothetical protein